MVTDWAADGARSHEVTRVDVTASDGVVGQLLLGCPIQVLQQIYHVVGQENKGQCNNDKPIASINSYHSLLSVMTLY